MARVTSKQQALGQVLTPVPVGRFMASLLEISPTDVHLLDPGAGAGSLSAAVTERWIEAEAVNHLEITAVEIDPEIRPKLRSTLTACASSGAQVSLIGKDFLGWAGDAVARSETFDAAILNPPYKKINLNSVERAAVAAWQGPDVSNLYAAFVAAALKLLRPGGQLVAITPRSWANGPYFERFRRYLFDQSALTHLHVYETRDTAFAKDNVLQETVIFRLVKGQRQGDVTLSHSLSPLHQVREMFLPFERVVRSSDETSVVHLEIESDAVETAETMASLPSSLSDLAITVSTGRVVDFRCRESLRFDPEPDSVPLIYPVHLRCGRVIWPIMGGKKPNALAVTASTRSMLLPNETYVVVKRFSSKEERRRIVATLSSPDDLPGEFVAFENHTNVFQQASRGLDRLVACGLTCFLNSSLVDRYFRSFSGHTQVNATDLRRLRYPSSDMLKRIGHEAGALPLTQDGYDRVLDAVLDRA